MDCVTHQAPPPVGFSRQEYWSGLPSPGDLSNPGIEPRHLALQTDSLPAPTHVCLSSALQADSLPAKPNALRVWKDQ